MLWSEKRILTTHTGSLPRPAELTRLYVKRARGEAVDEAELSRAGERALERAVQKQIAAGIDVGNNGEQQREAFFLYVRHRMSGFGDNWRRYPRQDVERYPVFKAAMEKALAKKEAIGNFDPPKAVGPVGYLDRRAVEGECRDFKEALARAVGGFAEAFMTAPSPGIIVKAMKNDYYDSEDAYLDAVAKALSVEYKTIVAEGFLLQLDCPDLALERHLSYQDQPLGAFLLFVEKVVAAINEALTGLPKERVRLHVCWGNYEGPHDCDVPLEEILPFLEKAHVGGFVLPFANPRHAHEIRVLERFPLAGDQTIVAGVIDSLSNFVEHPQVIADRLVAVAEAQGDPHRVLAGSDCGFDTSAGMGRVAEDVVWAKLKALGEGALLASQRLGLIG